MSAVGSRNGARSRFWTSGRHDYLLPRESGRAIGFRDVVSDAWVDAHLGVDFADRTRLGFDVGLGARIPVVLPLQLGLFVRYLQLFPARDLDETTFKQLMFGLATSLGFRPLRPRADRDGDGIPDENDRCPRSRPGVPVDRDGCEVAATVRPPAQCPDADLDGVCDEIDACERTVYGAPVDLRGCSPEQVGPAEPAPE